MFHHHEKITDPDSPRSAVMSGPVAEYQIEFFDGDQQVKIGYTNLSDKGRDAGRLWVAEGEFSKAIWYHEYALADTVQLVHKFGPYPGGAVGQVVEVLPAKNRYLVQFGASPDGNAYALWVPSDQLKGYSP